MKKRAILAVLGVILLTIFLRIPYAYEKILNPDEANFTIVAREVLKGKLIYKDTIDTRPPLGYLLYMLVEIGNKKNTLFGVHLLTIFWVILTTLILIHIANYISGDNIGYITGFLYSIFSMGYYPYDAVCANAEIFMILPLVLSFLFFSYYLFKKKNVYCFLSAFMVGVSFLFKQTGIYNILPVFLVSFYYSLKEKSGKKLKYIFDRQTIPVLFIVGIGFLLPFLITLLYFVSKNNLDGYIYANFILGQRYVKAVTLKTGLYRNIAMTAHLIIPNFILFGFALSGVSKIFLKNQDWENKKVEYKLFIFFLFLQTIFSFFGAYTGKRPIAHYYLPVFPSVVLLAGYGFKTLQEEIFMKYPSFPLKLFWKWVIILGILNSFITFHDISDFTKKYRYIFTNRFQIHYEEDEISLYIKTYTTEKDKIYVWGYSPEIYLWSNRSPASPFFIPDIALGISPGGEKFTDTRENIEKVRNSLVEDFSKNIPLYIIDTSQVCNMGYENFPLEKISILWQFVQDRYILEKEIGKIKIYRRRDNKISGF